MKMALSFLAVLLLLYLSPPSKDLLTAAKSVDVETTTPPNDITDQFSEEFISCPKFFLQPGEYTLFNNGTVYIAEYGRWYDSRNYYSSNGTLYVCAPFYIPDVNATDERSSDVNRQNFSSEFAQCLKFGLFPDEYILDEDKIAHVAMYNKTYSPSEYLMRNRTLYVCAPTGHISITNETISVMADFPLVVLTYGGLAVSITCLILHLVVFLIVPFAKTLSGCCLASLSAALLLAYISFLSMPSNEHYACAAVGRATYYFFMSSFFWMNTISLDVFKSFYFVAHNISSASKWIMFSSYSAYSWITPIVFVVLTVIADNSELFPEEYRPRFGADSCWFGEKRSLVAFFVIPLLVIMIVNLLCFLASILFVQQATSKSTLSRHNALRQNFAMSMKLLTVMGLSWIFGIVAGATNIKVLWYIFVILNTLQGMFIFLSFSLTKKIRKYLNKKVFGCCSRGSSAGFSPTTCPNMSCTDANTVNTKSDLDLLFKDIERSPCTLVSKKGRGNRF